MREIGIEPVTDSPELVNPQDHLAVLVHYARKTGSPFQELMRFDRIAVAMIESIPCSILVRQQCFHRGCMAISKPGLN